MRPGLPVEYGQTVVRNYASYHGDVCVNDSKAITDVDRPKYRTLRFYVPSHQADNAKVFSKFLDCKHFYTVDQLKETFWHLRKEI